MVVVVVVVWSMEEMAPVLWSNCSRKVGVCSKSDCGSWISTGTKSAPLSLSASDGTGVSAAIVWFTSAANAV